MGISMSFKVVMICAASKEKSSSLIFNNQEISFQASSNRVNNIYLPDDKISITGSETWRDFITNNQQQIPFKAYELYRRDEYRQLYDSYRDSFYILSAGWGLVNSEFRLPRYDITFLNKNQETFRNNKVNNYEDFNQLILKPHDEIIFIGTEKYLPLFFNLTDKIINKKIIYWRAMGTILNYPLPNETFEYRKYVTNTRTLWHYELAKKNASGEIS